MKNIYEVNINELPNPLTNPPWSDCGSISVLDVINNYEQTMSPEEATRNKPSSRQEHIARIAYLVLNCSLMEKPITVFKNKKIGWPVKDGNHRLAAAIVLGDKTIKVNWI